MREKRNNSASARINIYEEELLQKIADAAGMKKSQIIRASFKVMDRFGVDISAAILRKFNDVQDPPPR